MRFLGSFGCSRRQHDDLPRGSDASLACGKPAIEVLFARFEATPSAAGFLAIIDATIVAAPKQRNTDGEKRDVKEGRIPTEWANKRQHPVNTAG